MTITLPLLFLSLTAVPTVRPLVMNPGRRAMGRNSYRHGGLYKYEAVREWPSISNIAHMRRKVGIVAFSARGEHAFAWEVCSLLNRDILDDDSGGEIRSRRHMFQCLALTVMVDMIQ
jgi:hypothetical protein